MEEIWKIMHHPAGKTGIAVGLTAGITVAFVYRRRKPLLFLTFLTCCQHVLRLNAHLINP
jgi:energy-converting hydrogenase Eha subunit G